MASFSNKGSVKRKRVVVSMEKKLEAINRIIRGESLKKIAVEFGVGETTVGDWKRNRVEIEDFCAKLHSKDTLNMRSTLKKAKSDELDEAIYLWFSQQRAQGIPISGPILQEKAILLNQKLNAYEHFSGSKGWLDKFKKRHGIRQLTVASEKLSAGPRSTQEFVSTFEQAAQPQVEYANHPFLEVFINSEVDEGTPSTAKNAGNNVPSKASTATQSLAVTNSSEEGSGGASSGLWTEENAPTEPLPDSSKSPGVHEEESMAKQDEGVTDMSSGLHTEEIITEGDHHLKPVPTWTYMGGYNRLQKWPATLQTYPSKRIVTTSTESQQQHTPSDSITDDQQPRSTAKVYCQRCRDTSHTSMQSDDMPSQHDNDEAEAALLQLRVDKLLLEMDKLQEERERIAAERRNMALRADITRLYQCLNQTSGSIPPASTLTRGIVSDTSTSSVGSLNHCRSSSATASTIHLLSPSSISRANIPSSVIPNLNRKSSDGITDASLGETVVSASSVTDISVACPVLQKKQFTPKTKIRKILPKEVVTQAYSTGNTPEHYPISHISQLSLKSKGKNSSNIVAANSGSVQQVYNVRSVPGPFPIPHTIQLSSNVKSSTVTGSSAQIYSVGNKPESCAMPHHVQISSKAKSRTGSSTDMIVGSNVAAPDSSSLLLASALTKTAPSTISVLPGMFMTLAPNRSVQQDISTTESPRIHGSIHTIKNDTSEERLRSHLTTKIPMNLSASNLLQTSSASSQPIQVDSKTNIVNPGMSTAILSSGNSLQDDSRSRMRSGDSRNMVTLTNKRNSEQIDSSVGEHMCSITSISADSSVKTYSSWGKTQLSGDRVIGEEDDEIKPKIKDEEIKPKISVMKEEVKYELDITEEIDHEPKFSYSISTDGIVSQRLETDEVVVVKRRKTTQQDEL